MRLGKLFRDMNPIKRCCMCSSMFYAIGEESTCEDCQAALDLLKMAAEMAAKAKR